MSWIISQIALVITYAMTGIDVANIGTKGSIFEIETAVRVYGNLNDIVLPVFFGLLIVIVIAFAVIKVYECVRWDLFGTKER